MLCRGVFNLRRDRHGDVCLHMGEEPVHMCDKESVISECGRQGIDTQGHGVERFYTVVKIIEGYIRRRASPTPETPPPLLVVVVSSAASDVSSASDGSFN